MSGTRSLEGLSLKVGTLGENDRLLTLLSEEEGLTRIAVPGARKPRSSLAAAIPLTLMNLEIVEKKSLPRVRHLKVLKSFNGIGQTLETLAGAQALTELGLLLVAEGDPLPGLLKTLLMHLERLDAFSKNSIENETNTVATTIQGCIHMLAIGGYGLPLQVCSHSGKALEPPLGQWDWRCSLIASEGFAIGSFSGASIQLNPSELALLQRLTRASLPIDRQHKLIGPKEVWIKLLAVVECWINTNLPRKIHSLTILHQAITQKKG